MKILVLAALIAVATGSLSSQSGVRSQVQGPWQVGKLYRYDVDSFTLATLQQGPSSGSAFKARFVIRVREPGRLLAKLENPMHAQVHQELLVNRQLPTDLKYQPVDKLDQPFEIAVEGGRVLSLSLPSALPLAQENLLKGLIGALQVDLSTHRHVRNPEYGYDKETQQGIFKKMETDVTGDCETLYNVYPVIPEWHRELPNFASEEDPIMISKTKNYGHCHHRVAYHFGVPEGSEWSGTAHKTHDEQFIRRATVSRILASKQGPIYKTETTSTVHVNPQLYGKDKAEVLSYVQLYLASLEQDSEAEWPQIENPRVVNNLLYSITQRQITISDDSSSASSSSESNEEYSEGPVKFDLNPTNRVRRSSKSPKVIAISKVIVKRSDDEASSSSSSSDSTSAFVNDDVPRPNEPAYAALYMSPQPRADKKQNPTNVQKLTQELAQQLQNPNNMPKSDFLSKFNILVRIIASMSAEQLSLTSRAMETAKTANNLVKMDIWMIYRDAVTQAGTMPAFQQIKTWISKKNIEGEEAAQVLATLVNTLRYPTKDIMTQFFKLAMSDEVRQQRYLNSTALIAATKFINMGQVNNETAHSNYPTHMYGRLARKDDPFVLNEILPILSQELQQAIQQGDSIKAQVYIRAIGNLGHRGILRTFAPYLEGKILASTYLRTQMVRSLDVLAHERDFYVRSVLFTILKNIAEPYEVRVAAIDNIFMARPSSAMMQAMAQMTHNDPSVQVRAVLKTSIESAAKLKDPHYLDVARAAQAVKWMLTKQQYGKQHSSKYLNDYKDMERELGILTAFSYIGSEDSLFPKYLKYSFKSKARGWNKMDTISVSTSSMLQLVNVLKLQLNKIRQQQSNKPESNHKYSAEKVFEMLNIKPNPRSPLEGALWIEFMGMQRLFPYSENDLQKVPAIIGQYVSNLVKGAENHYTKIINQAQVSIMFPVSMGMPFIYKYKEPTVFHIRSKAKGNMAPSSMENRSYSASMDKEIEVTYARNIDGSVGFMDTLSNQYASVGVVSKFQLYVPLKLQLQMKSGELKVSMEPLRPEQETTVLHYSIWPYSAIQKKDTLVPVALDQTTKVVASSKKVVSIDTKFGQSLGSQFQIQGYSHSSDYKNIGNIIQSRDLFSGIARLIYQRDVALTYFNLRYLGKQSQNKKVTFTTAYDTYFNQKQAASEVQPFVAVNVEDVAPNSENRRQEMVKRVSANMNSARVGVIDVSAAFEGPQKHEYVLTAAMGNSPIDTKIQYAFFAGRNSAQLGNNQVSGVVTATMPFVTSLNFLQAIQKEMKLNFEADIKYGQSGNGNIHMQGYAERSKKGTEEMLAQPLAKQCSQQMESNNLYQYACHRMIVRAHVPDYLKMSVSYKDVSPAVRNMTYQFFRMVDYLGFWFIDVNPMKTAADGKIEIEVQASYPDNKMNLAISTRLGEVRFNNLPVRESFIEPLAIYPQFRPVERYFNYNFRYLYQPFCTVDGNKIRTFSNRSYDYTLTRNWHVVMQEDVKNVEGNDELVILARRPNEKKQEVYMSYKSETGKNLELEIQPAPEGPNGKPVVKVNTNARKLSEDKLVAYLDDDSHMLLLEYYTQPDGVLFLNIGEGRLRALYDGERLVVLASQNRNNTRGICGRMNGDARDDFLAPNGIVDRPEHYGASYALIEPNGDPKTSELQTQASQFAYQPKTYYTMILPSDEEWKEAMQRSTLSERKANSSSWPQNVYKSRSYLKQRGPCRIQEETQYYEANGMICITISPLPACQSNCRGDGYRLHAAKVICKPKLELEFKTYRDQIQRGENPKVAGVPEQQPRQFQVPATCTA